MSSGRRSIALVARREITERMQGRAFLVSTIAIIAIVLAGVIVPTLDDPTTRFDAGTTGSSPPALEAALQAAAGDEDVRLVLHRYPTVVAGESALSDGDADVLIVGGERLIWNSEPDAEVAAVVLAAVQQLRLVERARELGLTTNQTSALLAPAPVPARTLDPPDPDQDAREAIAFVSFILLLMMLIFYGTAVAEGVAQEKGTRVMELLVCRVRPRDLLAGKVLGIGFVGLCQMLLALVAGAIAITALDTFDVPAAVPASLVSAVVWFALGFAFWSVALAAAGALVSRLEDLQAAVAPLTWTMTLCAFSALFASEAPDAWYSVLTSLLPITAPFAMPARIAVGDVPGWEIALAAAIMLAATYGLVRLGGAVYSRSLLRTGGRPRLRDIWDAARAR